MYQTLSPRHSLTLDSFMTDLSHSSSQDLIELSTDIVAAYVSNNRIEPKDLPALIQTIHQTLGSLGKVAPAVAPEPTEPQKPAVAIKKSVTPDYIFCLEDGLKFKSLKRHLSSKYGLSAEAYREKWGLPADYPMVAPNYASARSQLAKKSGLGRAKARRR
jgi:predicted transcriptional regulator